MSVAVDGLKVIGYETLDVSSTAVSLTQSKYDRVPPARGAYFTVDTAPIRFTEDGTTPTATEGHFIIPTDPPRFIARANLPTAQFIRQSSSDAKVRVNYVGTG